MLYRYNVILNIDPNEYDEIKDRLDSICNPANSSLKELSIKEQLKYYIELNVRYSTDKNKMFELIDML